MRTFKKFALAGLLTFTFVGAGIAADGGYILRTAPSAINTLANQFALKVDKDLSNGKGAYLVHLPGIPGLLQVLQSNPLVQSLEPNSGVNVPEAVAGSGAKFPTVPGTARTRWSQVEGVVVQSPGKVVAPSKVLYESQPGIVKINLPPPDMDWVGRGVKVAVIDTWIDASNTVLAPVINRQLAYDAIADNNGGASIQQETSPFIDQETSPFIDSTGTILVVNQETSPFIDQETSPFIDQETSPFIDGKAFGHGTMVAGLVHRVAPNATLIPIRAFTNDGSGSIADVIKGIYYAVDTANVDIISMSFSAPSDSPELKKAIRHAQDKGVICIASVSNSNSQANVYPAADEGVLGIAATTYADTKADFSDYGSDVELSAPGVYMTSTFPRNAWAMSSGTSFSTPLVSGAAAVLKSLNFSSIDADTIAKFLDKGADPILDPIFSKKMGAGRLDVNTSAKLVKSGDR